MKRKDFDRLRMWQERFARNQTAYAPQVERMQGREKLYRGDNAIREIVRNDKTTVASHVRNLCAELIEAQVDSTIPQPKVTAVRKKDERLAKIIEDMIRNELNRLPMEELNDQQARTVPIQGGGLYLVEWDNTQRTHSTIGEIVVSGLHPGKVIPQDGVYSGIEDMDYIFVMLPQTKEFIRAQYGVSVEDETESEPEVKGDGNTAEDMVTQYIAYFRNDKGGIGKFSWVNDVILEDLEDYQARRIRKCIRCGAAEPEETSTEPMPEGEFETFPTGDPEQDIALAQLGLDRETKPRSGHGRKVCPYCGGTEFETGDYDFEIVEAPIDRSDGTQIPGPEWVAQVVEGEDGMPVRQSVRVPTKIPYYRPDIYPVILQKNVSLHGSFLGSSDIDQIAGQQNTTNRLATKILDKLLTAGSYMSLPNDATIRRNTNEMKQIILKKPSDKDMIGVYDMEANITQDVAMLDHVYEEAKQIIGVTDSFLGRKDTTATSGTAKQFAAAQSAGRLESKRVMKQKAYAELFEAIFKFKLAYADEPRPIVTNDSHGDRQYEKFNRYDFLEQDETGAWYWNDEFLFSCDTAAPLASNREAMWQENLNLLQIGAFGNPAELPTLISFWSKMAMQHYPGAEETKADLQAQLEQQQEMQKQMQTQMQQMQQWAGVPPDVLAQVEEMARRDAARAVGQG